MWAKIKSMAKAVYSHIASRPADTWLHITILGILPSFTIGVMSRSFLWACVAGVFLSALKEIADYFDPDKHTCEWRDFANGCIGTVIGAVMALIAIT
jgi:hypothetical protein